MVRTKLRDCLHRIAGVRIPWPYRRAEILLICVIIYIILHFLPVNTRMIPRVPMCSFSLQHPPMSYLHITLLLNPKEGSYHSYRTPPKQVWN